MSKQSKSVLAVKANKCGIENKSGSGLEFWLRSLKKNHLPLCTYLQTELMHIRFIFIHFCKSYNHEVVISVHPYVHPFLLYTELL